MNHVFGVSKCVKFAPYLWNSFSERKVRKKTFVSCEDCSPLQLMLQHRFELIQNFN